MDYEVSWQISFPILSSITWYPLLYPRPMVWGENSSDDRVCFCPHSKIQHTVHKGGNSARKHWPMGKIFSSTLSFRTFFPQIMPSTLKVWSPWEVCLEVVWESENYPTWYIYLINIRNLCLGFCAKSTIYFSPMHVPMWVCHMSVISVWVDGNIHIILFYVDWPIFMWPPRNEQPNCPNQCPSGKPDTTPLSMGGKKRTKITIQSSISLNNESEWVDGIINGTRRA